MSNTDEALNRIAKAAQTGATELDLSNCGLSALPPELFALTQLEKLNLSGNALTVLPNSMAQWVHLRELDLSYNANIRLSEAGDLLMPQMRVLGLNNVALEAIPPDLMQWPVLEELHLRNNQLTALPDELGAWPTLHSVYLNGNPIQHYPTDGAERGWLRGISLTKVQLTALVPHFGAFAQLEELDLSGLQLAELPPEISSLVNLRMLNLSDNQLTALPPEITQLVNLQTLDLTNNRLTALSPEITQLINLRSLDLDSNQLADLPPEITQLVNLQTLNLSSNQLTALPPEITQLVNLQKLDLGSNQLTALPPEITQLVNLQSLDLTSNQLTALPPDITHLVNLQTLDLGSNQLTALPPEITQLVNLQTLGLGSNQLTALPPEITQLVNLRSLALSDNQLTALPPEITQLINLRGLDIGSNQLTALPPEITQLVNLVALGLSSNQLEELPRPLIKLPKLRLLLARDNPSHNPPRWVVEYGLKAIRAYIDQLELEGETKLREAKLIVLGETGAGKTSLRLKLGDPHAPLPTRVTEGIEITPWAFDSPKFGRFNANIWDFGGQEIYHATHQFFLTARSLYVLVANGRHQQDTDFHYWLRLVEQLGGNSPVIILNNTVQGLTKSIPKAQLRAEFQNILDIFDVDLSRPADVARVSEFIQTHLALLPHVGDVLPKSWIDARAALAQRPEPHISYEEFKRVCRAAGVADADGAGQTTPNNESTYDPIALLSGYLHDLGAHIHFQDKVEDMLNRTVFLKPNWVTEAVYRVLKDEQVKARLGRFGKDDLRRVWHEPQFREVYAELLKLLSVFELCYEVDRTGQYIAPQLLPDDPPQNLPPENGLVPLDADCTEIRYDYPRLMPRGMVSRFIVAAASGGLLADQSLAWRSGIVVQDGGQSGGAARARAQVEEWRGDQQIRVRLVGKNGRDLLTRIRYELDRISRSFNGLEFEVKVRCTSDACKKSNRPGLFPLTFLIADQDEGRPVARCQTCRADIDIATLLGDVDTISLDETKLRDLLEKGFNIEEMRTLCADLGIDDENIRALGIDKTTFARELVKHAVRHNRLRTLAEMIRRVRPGGVMRDAYTLAKAS